MNKKRRFVRSVVAMGVTGLLAWGRCVGAQPLQITVCADGFPPLQYPNAKGEPTGYVHAFVLEALARVEKELPLQQKPLQFMPLKRALALAKEAPNVLVLSVARTADREADYLWLRSVAPYQLWLYRARDQRLPALRGPDELKNRGLRFGVQDGSNFQEWLRAQGIGQGDDNSVVDAVPQNNLNFRKAQLKRIDLFAHPDVSLAYRLHEKGLNEADFEPVMPIQALSSPLWLVFSKGTDPRLVQALGQSLDALKASGRLEALRKQQMAQFLAVP